MVGNFPEATGIKELQEEWSHLGEMPLDQENEGSGLTLTMGFCSVIVSGYLTNSASALHNYFALVDTKH